MEQAEANEALNDKLNRRFDVRLALFLILILGGALRLTDVGRDVWFDEAASLISARGADIVPKIVCNGPEFTNEMFTQDGGWRGVLVSISHLERTPPLYFLLLRVWIKLFGEGNVIVRLPSLVFGIATILAVFFLGRIVFSETVGLAAAGILAVVPLHIQYSQEARAYALACFLVTLASLVFWSAAQTVGQPNERKYWVFYFSLAAAGLYTHYSTAGVFLAHGVFALLQPRARRWVLVKRLALVATALVIVLLPWLLSSYVKSQSALLQLEPKVFWTPETFVRVAVLVFYFFAGYLPDVKFMSGFGLVLVVLYGLGILAFSLSPLRKTKGALFIVLLLVVPVVFMVGVSAALQRSWAIGHPKFILGAVAGLSLLLGAAVVTSRQRALSLVIVVMAGAVSLYFQARWHRANTASDRQSVIIWYYGNVSSAAARVDQRIRPNELILFDDAWLPIVWNAYERTRAPQMLMGWDGFYLNPLMDFESRWQQVEQTRLGIYLVRRAEGPPSDVLRRLESHYRLAESTRIGRLEIRYYVKPSPT
jgi:4-amino-4-deoxy-L-arabinose transferase-like glycosyltransferase